MPSKLFEVGNPGRKLGSKNKTKTEIKEMIQRIVEDRLPVLLERIDELSIKEQGQLVSALLVYLIPKNTKVETSKAIELPEEIQALSFEQLEQIENIIKGKPIAYKIEETKKITNGSGKPF